MMIKKILIANRGEIACRIMKTCRKMGISTVAVYSEADEKALHAEMADEAYLIGPPAARESYLVADKIIAVAKKAGADAIHPGYGFLSENEEFAEAVAKAGLIFIGPPASAILAMGGKSEAKALMEKAQVPLVPGYHGDNQDEKFLLAEAEKIGFPVLIKASAGGGGKGMRVVESAKDLAEALAGAKREAKAAFGEDHVLIEKYLLKPRHVEIQVFADQHGNCVYLFERDCSVQRRHQKVLEEAPAPGMSEATRKKMGEAAVAAAKAINYAGAGTVEFLLDAQQNFYFMEMNTRLQVEHPVTEMITGLDLVELQIKVAQGEKLPFTQKDLKINGHAFESRLYAEDPAHDFLPGAGQIQFLRFPIETNHTRIDTGVREAPMGGGDVISIHYDPMIAKIITWGADRAAALSAMETALNQTYIAGLKTNLSFLRSLTRHSAFKAGDVGTHFIAHHKKDLLPETKVISNETYALAVLGLLVQNEKESFGRLQQSRDVSSPWFDLSGWRIGMSTAYTYAFKGMRVDISYPKLDHARPLIKLENGASFEAYYEVSAHDAGFIATLDGKLFDAAIYRHGPFLTVMHEGCLEDLEYHDPLHAGEDEDEVSGRLTAPMPGKVVAVRVQVGNAVKKGQPLVIVEAMKMEHTIMAPVDGIVEAVNANVGDQVHEKLELVRLK